MLLTNDLGADGKAAELAMQDPSRLKQLPIPDVRLAPLGLTLLDNYVQTRIWYQLDTASLVSPTLHFELLEWLCCTSQASLAGKHDRWYTFQKTLMVYTSRSQH